MSLLSDFGIGQVNKPIRVVTALPLTCKKGEIAFVVSSTANLNQHFDALAVNTWTLIFTSTGSSNIPDPLVIATKISSYNGLLTEGNGVVTIQKSITTLGVAANISATALTPGGVMPVAGLYKVAVYCNVNTRPTTGTLTVTIAYNDGNARSISTVNAADINSTTGVTIATGESIILADGAHNVTYAVTFASLTGTTPAVDFYLVLQRLN